MSGMRSIIFLVAGFALSVAVAPRAFGLARAGRQATAPPAVSTASQAVTNLTPIVVHGHKLPLPIVLQTIKTGLKLPWTSDLSDTRIRCRFETQAGSHFKVLWCESNRHHILRVQRLHLAMTNVLAGAGGSIPAVNVTLEGTHSVNESVLRALLKKLPPAGSSYTLRVPASDGKPEIDYIVKHGELVKILKYPQKPKPPSR